MKSRANHPNEIRKLSDRLNPIGTEARRCVREHVRGLLAFPRREPARAIRQGVKVQRERLRRRGHDRPLRDCRIGDEYRVVSDDERRRFHLIHDEFGAQRRLPSHA